MNDIRCAIFIVVMAVLMLGTWLVTHVVSSLTTWATTLKIDLDQIKRFLFGGAA